MPKLTRWRKASTSACSAARDRTNPRSVARSEISTEIIAAGAYPVVGRNFNGCRRIGVYSSHKSGFAYIVPANGIVVLELGTR